MVKLKDVVRNVISGANKQLPDHSTTQSTASTALATEIYTKISCIGPRALGKVRISRSFLPKLTR